ncbi:hypothetical protein HMPREF3202_00100 [Prevotella bivia]|uniref:Uncharacterized protein n=1 Tax=Prevotella bivia TaxID=28125 RepID=A0A137T144_9BACT|nr:hypothetical protein HMPREF3202_00100 [Prevotella bivia]
MNNKCNHTYQQHQYFYLPLKKTFINILHYKSMNLKYNFKEI